MNCDDLMNMELVRKGMRLVAGESGITRTIRWIYFADCVQCLTDDFNVAELIHGKELVIVTNESLTCDDSKIIDMIRVMNGKNIAGFVINEGQISDNVIDYCNEIELPLFEISVRLHLIDLSQAICKALVEEEINTNSRERILSTILYSDNINAEEVVEQANYLGVDISGRYRVVVLQIHDMAGLENAPAHTDEGYMIERREYIKKCVKNEFHTYGLKRMLLLGQLDITTAMVPEEMFSRDLLITILKSTIQKIESVYQVSARVGVGTGYEYIEDMKKSFQEAKNTLQISRIAGEERSVFFYEDLGIYSLIAQVKNGRFLDDYVESHLGELLRSDQIQDGDLCMTLETYLDYDCNANATAEHLFIHRNTMRYRMEKIRNILNEDVSDMSVCLELKLAFAIKKYRDSRIE